MADRPWRQRPRGPCDVPLTSYFFAAEAPDPGASIAKPTCYVLHQEEWQILGPAEWS